MALQNNGRLTLSQIATEFGGSAPHKLSEYYGSDSVPASGRLKMSDFYGASAMSYLTLAGGQDVNLETFITSQGLTSGAVMVTVTDHISSSSTSIPALQTGDLSAFNQVTLLINPSVMVVGRGGNGGRAGNGNQVGASGLAGGNAIQSTSSITIENNGFIYGGGGGGGGGAGHYKNSGSQFSGGGGGAGVGGGAGGTASFSNFYGQSSSLTTYGSGGNRQATYAGYGGRGGNYGEGGYGGGYNSPRGLPGGAGGAAGKALVGNTFVTWINQGTTAGVVE